MCGCVQNTKCHQMFSLNNDKLSPNMTALIVVSFQ